MATLDVLSLVDATTALGYRSGDPSKMGRLESLVTAVSTRLDELVGPIVRRTVTEHHDGGCSEILLRRRPVASITSVTEYAAGVATVLTAETVSAAGTYVAPGDPDNDGLLSGTVVRRSGFADAWFPAGRGNVVVVHVAGRYASTADVAGTRYHEAALLMLRTAWQSDLNSTTVVGEYEVPQMAFPSVAVPQAVRDLLADQLQFSGIA